MSPGWKRIPCRISRKTGLRLSRNSRSIPKCLNSSSCAFSMIARASRSRSSERRCSYQPIASASSISEVQMRAKVRVSSGSSSGGSWYWSNGTGRVYPCRLQPNRDLRAGLRVARVGFSRRSRGRPTEDEVPERGHDAHRSFEEADRPANLLGNRIERVVEVADENRREADLLRLSPQLADR